MDLLSFQAGCLFVLLCFILAMMYIDSNDKGSE
jgi:hypothetical protein